MRRWLAVSLMLLAGQVSSAEWVRVGETTSDDVVELDVASVQRRSDGIRAWVQVIYVNPKKVKEGVGIVKYLYSADCRESTLGAISWIEYGRGNQISEVRDSWYAPGGIPSMFPVAPESVGEMIAVAICRTASSATNDGEARKMWIRQADAFLQAHPEYKSKELYKKLEAVVRQVGKEPEWASRDVADILEEAHQRLRAAILNSRPKISS